MKKLILGLVWGMLLSISCSASPLGGTVYGVFPEGVMVDYGQGAYLVPVQQATFEVGGMRATWSNLQPGQLVDVIMPDRYLPSIVRIADPYQWKLKHHPNHPHGGPPGQMKKNRRGNNGKGKGKGKKKGW